MSENSDMIYANPYPEYEELFKKVEAALGFKLYKWQKSYIVTKEFRWMGVTTAKILRELLNTEAEPLDFRKWAGSEYESFYRHEMLKIQTKLQNAGIKTRVIFRNDGDKQAYVASQQRGYREW